MNKYNQLKSRGLLSNDRLASLVASCSAGMLARVGEGAKKGGSVARARRVGGPNRQVQEGRMLEGVYFKSEAKPKKQLSKSPSKS